VIFLCSAKFFGQHGDQHFVTPQNSLRLLRLAPLVLTTALGCKTNNDISSAGGSGGGGDNPTGGRTGSGTGGKSAAPDADFGFEVRDGGAMGGAPGTPCTNLCTRRVTCPGGDTTLSGTVFAPTPPKFGKPDPIYNALVYIPNGKVEPFTPGVSCDMCGTPASGSPLVTALTGPDGKFTLKNVPVGANIPLVIQVGRWRRQVTIPNVNKCADNPLDAELTRLPRNKQEGDIPLMAISTGNADALECVLRKIGVDETEFTQPTADGRIHLYMSNGAFIPPMSPAEASLSGSLATLKRYDIAFFECEGTPIQRQAETDAHNLVDYSNAGGRLFLTHYRYTWLRAAPTFNAVATWDYSDGRPTAGGKDPITGTIDQTFPKGMAFAQWLQIVGATSPMPGQISIASPRQDVQSVMPPTRQWITSDIASVPPPHRVQHFTFNTPVAASEDKQCGRVLFSDFHVSDLANVSLPFPTECNDMPLTPQEKALEFMIFDLSSCVQPDSKPPIIP
jgi:hypothetical protein